MRITFPGSVFQTDTQPTLPHVVSDRPENPHPRINHFHYCVHTLSDAKFQHAHVSGTRDRVAIQGDYVELVPWQMQLNVFCCARIEDMKKHALPFLHSERFAVAQCLSVDRADAVSNLHGARPRFVFVLPGRVIVLLRHKPRFPLVGYEKDLLVVTTRISPRFHINERELAAINPARQIIHGHGMGVHITGAAIQGSDLILEMAACGNR